MEKLNIPVEAVCSEFGAILDDSAIMDLFHDKTVKDDIRLAGFSVKQTETPDYLYYSLYLAVNGSDRPKLQFKKTYYYPFGREYAEKFLHCYIRGDGGEWCNSHDDDPKHYSDKDIAEMFLHHGIKPGEMQKKVQEAIEAHAVEIFR